MTDFTLNHIPLWMWSQNNVRKARTSITYVQGDTTVLAGSIIYVSSHQTPEDEVKFSALIPKGNGGVSFPIARHHFDYL